MKHSIENHIRKLYMKKMISPFIMAVITLVLLFFLPLKEAGIPEKISLSDINQTKNRRNKYVSVTVPELDYTGYDYMQEGRRLGSYYYTIEDGTCFLMLLKIQDASFFGRLIGEPRELSAVLTDYTVTGKLRIDSDATEQILTHMAESLSWSYENIAAISSVYMLDECKYFPQEYLWLYYLLLAFLGLHCLRFFFDICMIIFPAGSPFTIFLIRYGTIKEQIRQADKELEENLIYANGSFRITENYFIQLGKRHLYLIPRRRIIWIYKVGSSEKFLFFRFPVTYRLHILAHGMFRIETEDVTNEMSTEMIQILKEAHPNLITTYTERNKKHALMLAKRRGRRNKKNSEKRE